jgi:hypothetical protein
MIAGLLKLAAITAAVLGPFAAGTLATTLAAPAGLFLVLAGLGLGLGGLFGFAALERPEIERHARRLGRFPAER